MTALCDKLTATGIKASLLHCDHLCFRVGTPDEYEFYKEALSHYGELLTEALVNGRPICTFKLATPFKTKTHEIPLVELPAPKKGAIYSTGFEHAEFVINECFSDFLQKYPALDFIEAGNKTLNPELCLKLGSEMQAKFHHLSLERVIELEETKIQHVIFDFDGTLIKSRETIHEINRIVFSKALDREVTLQESVENFHPEFSKLFDAFNVTNIEKQREAVASWGTVASQFSYELFDGALEILNDLRAHGLTLHLWTARDEDSTRKILEAHKITDYFMTLSFATAVDSKPHANSLQFDWRGVPKDQVIVIGDSPTDILGARNISAIRGAALWDQYSKRSSLIETGAELFFYEMKDVKEFIIKR